LPIDIKRKAFNIFISKAFPAFGMTFAGLLKTNSELFKELN